MHCRKPPLAPAAAEAAQEVHMRTAGLLKSCRLVRLAQGPEGRVHYKGVPAAAWGLDGTEGF